MCNLTPTSSTPHLPRLHSRWKAVPGDRVGVMEAVTHFNYPQPQMVKDFSTAFEHMSASILFTFERDLPGEYPPGRKNQSHQRRERSVSGSKN